MLLVYYLQDLSRDYFKQSYDSLLTPISNGWSTSPPIVSNAQMVYRASENTDTTFLTSKIITNGGQNLFYPNYALYSIFQRGSGNYVQTLGGVNTTINSTYNTITDWNSSKLRIDSFSIAQSGQPCNFDLYSTKVIISCSGSFSPASSATNTATLYTLSRNSQTNNITLQITGLPATIAGRTLYIHGLSSISGHPTLYIRGS